MAADAETEELYLPQTKCDCTDTSDQSQGPSQSASPNGYHQDIPIPPQVPVTGISIQAHKLWIGNLDKRLTQQNILQFSSPYGTIVAFKYMLYTTGIEKGEPRGYCFVEYSTREEAEVAKKALNGKTALGKKLTVDWARQDQYNKKPGGMVSETWDASSVSATLQKGASTAAKIAALEAKLLQMDKETSTTSDSSSSSQISYNLHYSQEKVRMKHGNNIRLHRPQKPYTRPGIAMKK